MAGAREVKDSELRRRAHALFVLIQWGPNVRKASRCPACGWCGPACTDDHPNPNSPKGIHAGDCELAALLAAGPEATKDEKFLSQFDGDPRCECPTSLIDGVISMRCCCGKVMRDEDILRAFKEAQAMGFYK